MDAPDRRATASPMSGLMMDRPLAVSAIAERAGTVFGDREVVSRTMTGLERSTYADVLVRARRLASALRELGIGPGDRVATFGWNSVRHLELYLAVPSLGAVLHTLNIRLFADDLRYIVEHAEDRVLFFDASLAGTLPGLPGIVHRVVMPDAPSGAVDALPYEDLVEAGDPAFAFPEIDERRAAAMCYTSGTTGRPKGVVYSHRSIALYTLMANQPDAFGIGEVDSVMPLVPMFHANAWGLPYIAAAAGARQVMPGPAPTPQDIVELITDESVTISAAVPTVWQTVVDLPGHHSLAPLREAICGGSAVPETLIRAFDERFGVPVVQGWGMTETSPLAAISRLPAGPDLSLDQQYALRAVQGRVLPFLEARLDATAGNELQVRGPTIARGYYRDESASSSFTDDGWLRTGDVAEIDERSYVRIVDRTKDLVKSGGEWISSVELEMAALAHPAVAEAAVVAVPHPRWGERPCMFVVPRSGKREQLDAAAMRAFLKERVAGWWLPDHIELVDEIPKTSVGKLDKNELRRRIADGDVPIPRTDR